MQDAPSSAELIDAVVVFLRETAIALLPERQAFEARVAANVLEIVRREITLAPASDAAERTRLAAILDSEATLDEMNARLAAGLADGSIDAQDEPVMNHLWASTLEKLAVDQPRYATYRRALERGEGPP